MKKQRSLFIFAFSAMFMIGYLDSLRGPLIPDIRQAFSISYSSVGVIFLVAGFGFLIAALPGGILCDRFGEKKVLTFGLLCVISGIIGISYSRYFGIFLFMMGFLNIGLSSVEMGVNSVVSRIEVKNQAVIMNLLHFFYGFGASTGPRYSGQMLSMGMSWRRTYLLSLVVILSVFIYLVCTKFPPKSIHGQNESLLLLNKITNKRVLLYGAALGIYVSSEIGLSNWFVNYLTAVYHMNALRSSNYLSAFFILFTIGRLVGGFIAEKMGYFNSILAFMTSALLLFSGGVLLGENYVIFISICGLSYSIVYPTIVSALIKEFKQSTGSVLGVVITVSSAISMTLNWFIGQLNDMFDVKSGFMVIMLYIFIDIVLIILLKAGFGKNKALDEETAV